MGRGIVHRKVQQNKRRDSNPGADRLMAATHYDAPPQPEQPPVDHDAQSVTLTRRELSALLSRLAALETPPEPPLV